AVELAQRLAQHVDRLRAGGAECGSGGDRLLHRVDRGEMGDEEGEIDADEDDQDELDEPRPQVGRVTPHLSHVRRSRTNMYLELDITFYRLASSSPRSSSRAL